MHTMTPQGVTSLTPSQSLLQWRHYGGGTTPANSSGARKNLVLVYLIFTFQLFFGPNSSFLSLSVSLLFSLSLPCSSHNFFAPFYLLLPFSIFHFARACESRLSLCPLLLCLLWLSSSPFGGFLYLFPPRFPFPCYSFYLLYEIFIKFCIITNGIYIGGARIHNGILIAPRNNLSANTVMR